MLLFVRKEFNRSFKMNGIAVGNNGLLLFVDNRSDELFGN